MRAYAMVVLLLALPAWAEDPPPEEPTASKEDAAGQDQTAPAPVVAPSPAPSAEVAPVVVPAPAPQVEVAPVVVPAPAPLVEAAPVANPAPVRAARETALFGDAAARKTQSDLEHGLWLSLAVSGGALIGSDGQAANEITRLGFGWTNHTAYARLSAGFLVGSTLGQNRGLEAGLGLGWVALPWLQVGGFAGYRVSSAEVADPWADQAWFAGLESTQCLYAIGWGLDLCVRESLGGGQWIRRAEDLRNELVFVPQTERGAFLLDLAVVLRQSL